ncbi:hypothetical protein [Paenibacillus dendritiformis]|uniref:hypothetical protein n=1 Tax=Paenibacillus dendritiformis TaxID=130049 RepID=UPI0002F57877|nr:hypothetical protein [Paenibacillus dendritiformis]CAH8770774.1 hypothetical protein H7S4_003509 [Paenibacillus dendritiformis]
MAGLADLLEVLNKEAGFAKLLQGAPEDNSLISLDEILEQINQQKHEWEERSV